MISKQKEGCEDLQHNGGGFMTTTGISGRQITDVYSGSNLLTYKTYIRYNGASNPDKNLYLKDYPAFSFPSYNTNRVGYPYKAGEDIFKDGGSTNLIITCKFGLLRPSSLATFNNELRTIRKWLSVKKGYLEIVDEGASRFYEVLNVTIDSVTRETQAYGEVEVSFECTPYEYDQVPTYSEEITIDNNQRYKLTLANDADEMKPTFEIIFQVGSSSESNVVGSDISGSTEKKLFTISNEWTYTLATMKQPANTQTSRIFLNSESMIVLAKSSNGTARNYTQYFTGNFDLFWIAPGASKDLYITPTLATANSKMKIIIHPRKRYLYE